MTHKTVQQLRDLTGLGVSICQTALRSAQCDVFRAIRSLQESGHLPRTLTVDELKVEISKLALSYAEAFMDVARRTGELTSALEIGTLKTIRDNFYYDSIAGHANDFALLFKKDLRWLSPEDARQLNDFAYAEYARHVDRLCPKS